MYAAIYVFVGWRGRPSTLGVSCKPSLIGVDIALVLVPLLHYQAVAKLNELRITTLKALKMMDKIPKVRLKSRANLKTLNCSNKTLNMLFPIILLLGTTACATTERSQIHSDAKVDAPEESIKATETPETQTPETQSPEAQSIGSLALNTPSSNSPIIYGGPKSLSPKSSETPPHDSAIKKQQIIKPIKQQITKSQQNIGPTRTQVEQKPQSPRSMMVAEKIDNSGSEIFEDSIEQNTIENAKDTIDPQDVNVDISDQYTDYDGPVPVIHDPKSCGTNKYEIRVNVVNVAKEKGIINADLHNDVRKNFLVGAKAVLRIWATAHKGQTSFCIPLSKPGDYAVAIYHDKNGNHKFDKNFLGIPKERFGMSNNPRFGTKAPKYEQAVFHVPADGASITIKLRKASDILGSQK